MDGEVIIENTITKLFYSICFTLMFWGNIETFSYISSICTYAWIRTRHVHASVSTKDREDPNKET